jgi:c-di-GMP-binding flagellar brake protein YcgR
MSFVMKSHRRAVRRAVRLSCQVVSEEAFRLVGRRALDLSPAGMLLESDEELDLGEELLVSFRAPRSGLFIDTRARVVRVVAGRRPGDHGRCLGLRFEQLDPLMRSALSASLAGLPPPLPQRASRVDYAATIRAIAA